MLCIIRCFMIFFFKQKTAYEMRISDWSSDVCSSDLYFRRKLIAWKDDILRESNQTLQHLQEDTSQEPDIADRASTETDRALELRTRDRQRKLIAKIEAAMKRIEDGSYGYRSEEHTSELQSLMRISYAVFCLKKKKTNR